MLTGGALSVIGTTYYNSLAFLAATFREFLIAYAETEVRQVRDIGTIGKNLSTRRHDMVCCDIVAYL